MRFFFILTLVVFGSRTAQAGTSEETMRQVAATALQIGKSAAAIQELKTRLERRAIEHTLTSRPDLQDFDLKFYAWEISKLSDIALTTNVTFLVTPKNGAPFIILMVTRNGWQSTSKINSKLLHMDILDQKRWSEIMKTYLMTAGIAPVSDVEKVPSFIRNPSKKYQETLKNKNLRILKEGRNSWGYKGNFSIANILGITPEGITSNNGTFPLRTNTKNGYMVGSVDDNLSVIYTQKAMRLFYKDNKFWATLKPAMVIKISKTLFEKSNTIPSKQNKH